LDGTIRVFLADALFPLTGLVTAAFLTRRLGPGDYGLLTLAATVVLWVEGGISALLSRSTIKLIGDSGDWTQVGLTVMRVYLFVGCGAGLVLYLAATPIAALLQEPALAVYLSIFALDVPIHALSQAHRNILVGVGAFKEQALTSTWRSIARLILIILLVELGLSVPGAILASIGASVVELVVARWYVRPPLFRGSPLQTKQLWRDAIPLFFSSMALALGHRIDLVILKILGGTAEQVGWYGGAQNLSLMPGLFAASFAPLLLSALSRLARTNDAREARALVSDTMRLIILLLPFAGMTAGMAPDIVAFVFGPRFQPAAQLLAVLIFGSLGTVMISVASATLTAAGKATWTMALVMPLVPLAVVGHVVLIPQLGPLGAALVTASLKGLGAVAAVLAVYWLWGVLPPFASVTRSCLICGATFVLASMWPTPDVWVFVKVPLIAIFICVAFIRLGEFTRAEIAMAVSLVRWRPLRESIRSEVE
jgi:O-antigen/teichoic acid export membrane protein